MGEAQVAQPRLPEGVLPDAAAPSPEAQVESREPQVSPQPAEEQPPRDAAQQLARPALPRAELEALSGAEALASPPEA